MGTEAFWIPAVVAALSTGAEAVNQHQANNRQQNAEAQSIMDQQKIQQQAAGSVNKLTQQIAQDSPQKIQAKSTGDYVSQLRRNAAGSTQGGSTTGSPTTFGASTSALAPNVGASSRYGMQTAGAQREVQDYGNQQAGTMGALDAATRERQNEGLAMQTEGGVLNGLNQQSYTTNFVDQLRAQAAGQANPWMSLASGLLKNGAMAYASGAGGSNPGVSGVAKGSGGYNIWGAPLDAGNGFSGVARAVA